MSLSATLSRSLVHHATRNALCCGDKIWTYAELDQISDTLARGLSSRGIQPGDRLAFLLPNGPEGVFLNLACYLTVARRTVADP